MALPMAVLGILQLASTGMQAYGQHSERKAQAEAAQRNAAIMRQQADLTGKAGEFDVLRLQKQKSSFEGTQRAGFARSGVSSLQGSPLAVIAGSATEFELDIAASRFDTRVQQMRLMSQADEDMRLAKRARSAGRTEAFTTVLKGVSSLATSQSGGMIGQRTV